MAMSAYYLKGVAPKGLELWTIFKGCFPFLGMVLFSLVVVYAEPRIVTWLPDFFYSSSSDILEIDPDDPNVINPDFFE